MIAIRFLSVLCVAAALSACATRAPAPVPYDRQTANVKTIGIVMPAFPEEPAAIIAVTMGQNFGLLGALMDAGAQMDRESKLAKMLQDKRFLARDRFLTALRGALEDEGYQTTLVVEERPERTAFMTNYPPAEQYGVDAYLDVVPLTYGYLAASAHESTPYRPLVATHVRLVRAEDMTVLMEDRVYYNPFNPGRGDAVTISPDLQYSFSDFPALLEDGDRAAEGLGLALETTSSTVATLLR